MVVIARDLYKTTGAAILRAEAQIRTGWVQTLTVPFNYYSYQLGITPLPLTTTRTN